MAALAAARGVTDIDDLGDPPPRGRRPRLTRLAPEVQGADREALSLWIKEQLESVERDHQERIEMLRQGREHPCPAFERIVRNHGIVGTPKTVLAKLLGISKSTLDTHYGEVYDIAAAEIMAKVASNMVRIATSTSDPSAAKVGMDMLARRGGENWRPATKRLEVDNDPNKAGPPVIDSSKLTYEERAQLREMLERVANGGEGDPQELEDDQQL